MEFSVDLILEATEESNGFGGFSLHERTVDQPWTKDLLDGDSGEENLRRFTCPDNSSFFVALDDEKFVGGAAGLKYCPDAEFFCMTDGREDIAVLRDIRVDPDSKRSGVGRQLFQAVVDWAKDEGLGMLKIETQNNNVAACRFYRAMGARLGGVQKHAYGGEFSDEVMLLWYLDL